MNHHDYVTVVEHNPHEFMREFQDAVLKGYGVSPTIEGFPMLQGILKSVRMFKQDESDVAGDPADFLDFPEVFVVEYCEVAFLEKTQAVIQAGYRVNQDTVNMTSTPRSVVLDKIETEETHTDTPAEKENAVEDATEAQNAVVEEAPAKTRKPRKGATKNA